MKSLASQWKIKMEDDACLARLQKCIAKAFIANQSVDLTATSDYCGSRSL